MKVNFLRQRRPEKEPQSLSLIYDNGECSIDLICKDKEQTDTWFLGLTSLISGSRQCRPLTDSRHNQQATSCIYSPASFIRRKHRLATIQEPIEVSQRYGPVISTIPQRLSRFQFNMVS